MVNTAWKIIRIRIKNINRNANGFFFSANSNSGNNNNNKDVSEIVDKCNLDFFFPYDHWETSFSTFAKLVITSLELVFDLTLLVSTTSTKERTAGKLKAINQASFATLMSKPFQRYRYVTVELQRYLTLCGYKIMQMRKPGIQSVINTRNIIWKPRNKDIF